MRLNFRFRWHFIQNCNNSKGRVFKKINYAGNHGLDWQIAGKKHRVKVPQKIKKAIDRAANELSKFLISYPGIIFENKKLTLALHYRLLEKIKTRKFEKDFEKFILQPTYENLDLIKNIKRS